VAFVVSTYGDGEPTDNAKDFMNWLLDDAREPNMLNRLKYIIFGLGNKTYEHYNAVRHRRLSRAARVPLDSLASVYACNRPCASLMLACWLLVPSVFLSVVKAMRTLRMSRYHRASQ